MLHKEGSATQEGNRSQRGHGRADEPYYPDEGNVEDAYKENAGAPQHPAAHQHVVGQGRCHQHAYHAKRAPLAASETSDKDIEDIDRRLEALQEFLKAAKAPA